MSREFIQSLFVYRYREQTPSRIDDDGSKMMEDVVAMMVYNFGYSIYMVVSHFGSSIYIGLYLTLHLAVISVHLLSFTIDLLHGKLFQTLHSWLLPSFD